MFLLLVAPCWAWAHAELPASNATGEGVLRALLLAAGACYAWGFWRVRRASVGASAVLSRRGLLFAAGWLVIAASLMSPLHELGGRSFTAHMIEHELLMLLAAPLIALSQPIGVLLWALPRPARYRLAQLGHSRWYAAPWACLSGVLGASLLQAAMLWIWHAPVPFGLALEGEWWHAAQHVSLLCSSVLFWWSINTASSRQRRHAVAAFFLFFASMHSGLLGALMAFAASPWYERYAALGMSGTAGLTPLEDQQLAGLVMWIPGGAVHALAALIYLHRWFRVPRATVPRPVTTAVLILLAGLSALMARPAHAAGQGNSAPARELKVCADPNNLPFSNEREEGFENRLAALVARDLNAKLTYVWWAQRRGNVRETLKSGLCDIIPGVATGLEMLATTRPYYRSAYVFVTRTSRSLALSGFDDERLKALTIGVQMIGDDFSNTPPAHALVRRGMINNVRGYMIYGDYAQESPARAIVDDVAQGRLDVAVVWGPLAGYLSRQGGLTLQIVQPLMDGPMLPMAFDVSMGVRRQDQALRAELDRVLSNRTGEIHALLREYGVPLLDDH